MKKYLKIFQFNLKSKLQFKYDYLFSLISFSIHIIVFNFLWDYILKGDLNLGYTKSELIWYIIICEMIIYSVPKSYQDVSNLVKSGDIAYMLIKPISFIENMFFQNLTCTINLLVNFVFAIFMGIIIVELPKISLMQLSSFMISIIFSIILKLLLEIGVGLIAFFLEENKAVYLLISKLMMILVFTPVELFSENISKIFMCLPTTYAIYVPAKIFVHYNLSSSLNLILGQVISIIFLYFLIKILYLKGVRNINVNGG